MMLFLLASSLGACQIHAFLVIDREADDIHLAMMLNQIRWEHELKKIERFTQIQIKCSVHHDFSFLSDLVDLEVQSDDVILLYWCCHGFRPSNKDFELNPWPHMLFHADPESTLDFDEVVRYLETKGARLLITIAETCNHQIPFFIAPPALEFYPKGECDLTLLERYQKNCDDLFVRMSGVIKMSSSHPGQFSYAKSGSVFTTCFLETLKNDLYSNPCISWEDIFSKTTRLLFKINGHQEQVPFYEVSLRKSR